MKSVENSVKFSTLATQQYLESLLLLIFVHLVSAWDHWLSFMQTTPLNVTLQPYNWGVCLVSNLLDRDNISTEDNSPAPSVSVIQRFHCIPILSPYIIMEQSFQERRKHFFGVVRQRIVNFHFNYIHDYDIIIIRFEQFKVPIGLISFPMNILQQTVDVIIIACMHDDTPFVFWIANTCC